MSLFFNFEPLRHRLARYILKVVCYNYPTNIFIYGGGKKKNWPALVQI